MKITRLIFTLPAFLPLIIIACRFSASGSPPVQATPTKTVSAQQTEFVPHSESVGDANASFANFIPHSEPVGDPNANYANIEFTADGKYMVWFEMTHRQGNGVVWHCAINPETGDLIPADGRGFRAFDSTVFGRANPGMDSNGAYYVGMDRAGRMFLVRPTSATSGEVQALSTPPDPTRRAIYPTILPGQNLGYIFWIKNEDTPGGGTNRANDWFELQ